MNYLETLKEALILHPFVFNNEAAFLRHAFFVIGNGYEWANGELVDVCEYAPFTERKARQTEREMKRLAERLNRYQEEVAFYISLGDTDMPEYNGNLYVRELSAPIKIYPLCQYSKIMNLPDDITPDWLDAAKKALKAAKKMKRTRSDNCYLREARRRVRELERRAFL